jgi:hypothetical protein
VANHLYTQHTVVEWTDQYAVYTSVSTLASGRSANVGMPLAMSVCLLLTIGAGGSGNLTSNGIPDYFAVPNTFATSQVCGPRAGNTCFGGAAFLRPTPQWWLGTGI